MSDTPSQSTPGDATVLPLVLAQSSPTPLTTHKAKPLSTRIWCAFMFTICVVMLAIGFLLPPSNKGFGTHERLGLAPCGMLRFTGVPCPTCGCTTAVSYVAHGDPVKAFITQPFGALVGILGIVLGVMSLVGIVTGKWMGPSAFILNWYWRSIFFVCLALLSLAWIYKIVAVRWGIVV